MHKNAEVVNVVPDLKIDWKGIFDFQDLYKKMKFWLLYEEYGDESENFIESKYIERIKPIGKQIEVKWFGERPINNYSSYYITVAFTGIGLQDAEVTIEGRKIKMNKGQLILTIRGDLVLNRLGNWEKESFLRKLHDKRLFFKNIEFYKEEIREKVTDFHTEVKAYLNLHQF